MAVNKSRSAIAQLTGSGTSSALDVSGSYGQTLYVRHSNGTGSVTGAGSVQIQAKPSGGTFITLATFTFSTTAAQLDPIAYALPFDAAAVQLVYTAPTGPTGFTLDAEVGTVPTL